MGLNVTVLTGSVNVALKPAVPLDALLGGGRADTIESSACPPPVMVLLGRVLLCATFWSDGGRVSLLWVELHELEVSCWSVAVAMRSFRLDNHR